MKELLAYIGLNLPRRLREVLIYQPVKDSHAVNAYRASLSNPVNDIKMVPHHAPVDTYSRERLKPKDPKRSKLVDSQVKYTQNEPCDCSKAHIFKFNPTAPSSCANIFLLM